MRARAAGQHVGHGPADGLGPGDVLATAMGIEVRELVLWELDDGPHDDGIISRHHHK
jgi:hypothetical protein